MATKRGKALREKDGEKRGQKKVEKEEEPPPPVEVKMEEPVEKVEQAPTVVEEPVVEEPPPIEEPPPEPIYEEPILTQIIVERYEGEKYRGLYHGIGEAFFMGGHCYKGQFFEGLMHGEGTYTWSDGVVYSGEFNRNQVTGQGAYKWKDGSCYGGEVLNGLRDGFGQMRYTNGIIYDGQWIRGKQSGKGRIDYDSDGKSYYEGDWLDNVRHGVGLRCYPSGNTYDGQWYRNVRQGEGTMNWFDQNQSYSGQWEDGVQHGIGQWTWYLKRGSSSQYAMRNAYHGQIRQGQRHGFGIFYYANGARYEGQWKNNVKCGEGKFVFKNGRTYEGMFENDRIVEFPQFEMDGRVTPDISQIRTRTPLPSACDRQSVHSNMSVNTYSPSFQLDIDYLLTEFEPVDREEEISQVMSAILRQMSGLHRIYFFYSRLGNENSEDNTYLMSQMQFWRFLKDCRLHHHDCGLVDMDRWIARDPTQFIEMHDPNRKVLFRDFINHLVVLAFRVYHNETNAASGRHLATCLTRLLADNVLKNACAVKGHFYYQTERAVNALAHCNDLHDVYLAFCTPRRRQPPDNTMTMRQFLLLLKDMGLISKDLTPKTIIDVLTSDDPKVRDPQGAVNLELEMGFLDFFEALVGCAEVYVTEAVLRDPSKSNVALMKDPSLMTMVQSASEFQLQTKLLESEEREKWVTVPSPPPTVSKQQVAAQAQSSPGLSTSPTSRASAVHSNRALGDSVHSNRAPNDSVNSNRAISNMDVELQRDQSKAELSREGAGDPQAPSPPERAEEMENLVANYSFTATQNPGDFDRDYGVSPLTFDPETRRFNFWTHQIHIFFVRKFFPAAQRLLDVRQLVEVLRQTKTCEVVGLGRANVDGC